MKSTGGGGEKAGQSLGLNKKENGEIHLLHWWSQDSEHLTIIVNRGGMWATR